MRGWIGYERERERERRGRQSVRRCVYANAEPVWEDGQKGSGKVG